MTRICSFGAFRMLLYALTAILLGGLCKPAAAQNIEDIQEVQWYDEGTVECISAIMASTDQSEIDTYSETDESYDIWDDWWDTYETAILLSNNTQIDQICALDDGGGDAYSEMSDPVVLGNTLIR